MINLWAFAGPIEKFYYTRSSVFSYRSELPLKEMTESIIVCRDENLPELARPSKQINNAQKIDVIETLEWIIEQRSPKWWVDYTKIQSQENAYRFS